MQKIFVSEKALAHLSRGLYRSPASALRELISNAWDANATSVRIDTNHPLFLQVSVEDNGEGFTKDEFERIMQGGIGDSVKRPQVKPLIHNRSMIGRLGIGMLGIAQICGAFTITSNPQKGEGFRARVHLYDFLKDRIDQDDKDIVLDDEIDVGEYEFLDFEPSKTKKGTLVVADDVHPTFVRTFQESLSFEKYSDPPLNNWEGILKKASSVHSLQELGDYWRLIWELAVASPITYYNNKVLPNSLIAAEQVRLKKYNFNVFVDGIKLFKPVLLQGNSGGYTTLKIGKEERTVFGKKLAFHGYLIVQEGSQIKPSELRGILIRIKNVGIGYYDLSLLDYRYNEGPRSRWVTGEIYVDEGLENALNIDRDSFNRFHPEFRELQGFVHNLLHNEIFSQSYKKIDIRSEQKAREREKKRDIHLERIVTTTFESQVELKKDDDLVERQKRPEVLIQEGREKIIISVPKTEKIQMKKDYQQLVSAILVIYEISLQEKSLEKKREKFTELLMDLLRGW